MGDLCRQRQLLLRPYFYVTRVYREKPIFKQSVHTILLFFWLFVTKCDRVVEQEVPTVRETRQSHTPVEIHELRETEGVTEE